MVNEEIREYELGRKEYRAVKRYLEELCSREQLKKLFGAYSNHYRTNEKSYRGVVNITLDRQTGILGMHGDSFVIGELYTGMINSENDTLESDAPKLRLHTGITKGKSNKSKLRLDRCRITKLGIDSKLKQSQ